MSQMSKYRGTYLENFMLDRLGILIMEKTFCDQTDDGKVFVCILLNDLLSLSF